MPVEGPIVDLSSLNPDWPLDEDSRTESHLQLQLTKDAIKKSFTHMAANGGVVTVTAAELSYMAGVTSNVQSQLDGIAAPWQYVDATPFVLTGKARLFCSPPFGGLAIDLPAAPLEGTEVLVMDILGASEPPNNVITVRRSGTDTLTGLDSGATGLTVQSFVADSQIMTLVYFSGVWYFFSSSL